MSNIKKKPTTVLQKLAGAAIEHERSVAVALWDEVNSLLDSIHDQNPTVSDRVLARAHKTLREIEESGWKTNDEHEQAEAN